MENNDQNLNKQLNINNDNINQQTPNNTNKIVIILMAIVIVGLVGYIVYIRFIQRENMEKPIDNNTQENGKQNSETEKNDKNNSKQNNNSSNIKLEGLTFKTSDGKNTLKIVSKNDSEAKSKANNGGLHIDDEFDYFGYYNDKIMLIFNDNPDGLEVNSNTLKYVVLGGQNGQYGQCRDSNGFIVNIVDNELVNLSKGSVYKVHKVGEKYYFSEGYCALGFLPIGVYDENLKKLGYYYLSADSSENIYVLDNNNSYIVKYNKNGNIVKKTSQKYTEDTINRKNVPYNDTLYIITYINNKMYLMDVSTEEKYELNGLDDDFAGISDDKDAIDMRVNNGVIEISRYTPEFDEQNNDWVDKYTTVYTFNPSTKTLLKK